MVGNTTLLIGADDDRIEEIRSVLREYCTPHKQINPSTASFGKGLRKNELGEEVISGGATMFILGVESCEKFGDN